MRVKQGGPDALVLAGLIEQNGARLIRDKVGVVGPNKNVPLIAFDGFAQQATIDKAAAAADGMFAGVPGRSPEQLPGAGRDFVREFEGRLRGNPVELYAPFAGEAAAVLLKAIAEAGPSRAATVDAVFATRRKGGILGSYSFSASGDPSVRPVTIFRARRTFAPEKGIAPEPGPVRAARLGR